MSVSRRKKAAREALHAKQKEQRLFEKKFGKHTRRKKDDYTVKTLDMTPKVHRREIPDYPSASSMQGVAAKKEAKVYSGDYIVGIATMHKSNLVPVGKGQDARDYATMRRN